MFISWLGLASAFCFLCWMLRSHRRATERREAELLRQIDYWRDKYHESEDKQLWGKQ